LRCPQRFFPGSASDFLQFAEPRQVILKMVIKKLRVLRAQASSSESCHAVSRMWKKGIFLQFSSAILGRSDTWFPQQKKGQQYCTQCCCESELLEERRKKCYAAVAATGRIRSARFSAIPLCRLGDSIRTTRPGTGYLHRSLRNLLRKRDTNSIHCQFQNAS